MEVSWAKIDKMGNEIEDDATENNENVNNGTDNTQNTNTEPPSGDGG